MYRLRLRLVLLAVRRQSDYVVPNFPLELLSDMADEQQTFSGLRLDPLIGGLLAVAILTAAAAQFGVWEPGKPISPPSQIIWSRMDVGLKSMLDKAMGQSQCYIGLTIRYWPVAGSVSLLGTSTLSAAWDYLWGADPAFYDGSSICQPRHRLVERNHSFKPTTLLFTIG